jgi:hypothetical protein
MIQRTKQIADSRQLKRTLWLLLFGLVLTIVTGVVCGRLSLRWDPSADMVAAGRHLQTLPEQFGDWQMVDQQPLPNYRNTATLTIGIIDQLLQSCCMLRQQRR